MKGSLFFFASTPGILRALEVKSRKESGWYQQSITLFPLLLTLHIYIFLSFKSSQHLLRTSLGLIDSTHFTQTHIPQLFEYMSILAFFSTRYLFFICTQDIFCVISSAADNFSSCCITFLLPLSPPSCWFFFFGSFKQDDPALIIVYELNAHSSLFRLGFWKRERVVYEWTGMLLTPSGRGRVKRLWWAGSATGHVSLDGHSKLLLPSRIHIYIYK